MSTRRRSPYVYVTWICSLLSGDFKCEWASWFRSNYQDFDKIPKDSNLTVWKANHSEMLNERVEKLKAEGWTVYVENQNKFNIKGKAATLGGCPDIVAVRDEPGMVVDRNPDYLVIDTKTGKPKDADLFQVFIYMMMLPLYHPACRGQVLRGELQYRDHSILLPSNLLSDSIKDMIKNVIERMTLQVPPPRTPSFSDCRFCDIGSDCPDRVSEDVSVIETNLF